MFLEALLGTGREVVSKSWTAATVLSKYIVLLVGARLAYERRLDVEDFREELLKHSRPAIYLFLAAGAGLALTGVTVEPFLLFFSQLAALGFLAFLFWSY
ncbi:MAG: hypothetical protein ABEJ75_02865 [Candidatus Nanohaloarchaea archaeon]